MPEKTITVERRAELAKALRDLSTDEITQGFTILDSGETVKVGTLLGEAATALDTPTQPGIEALIEWCEEQSLEAQELAHEADRQHEDQERDGHTRAAEAYGKVIERLRGLRPGIERGDLEGLRGDVEVQVRELLDRAGLESSPEMLWDRRSEIGEEAAWLKGRDDTLEHVRADLAIYIAYAFEEFKAASTQLLGGDRNLTLRTLADIAGALGRKATIRLEPIPGGKGEKGTADA